MGKILGDGPSTNYSMPTTQILLKIVLLLAYHTCLGNNVRNMQSVGWQIIYAASVFVLFVISLTADEPQRARLPIPSTATLPSCMWFIMIFPSLPGGSRFDFLPRCKFSTLLTY